ncbi:MAG: hypothetical protein RL757_2947 [Bacteroidota bacterium]|jgi:hypothetical protein
MFLFEKCVFLQLQYEGKRPLHNKKISLADFGINFPI